MKNCSLICEINYLFFVDLKFDNSMVGAFGSLGESEQKFSVEN